jgi:hypothetical protein
MFKSQVEPASGLPVIWLRSVTRAGSITLRDCSEPHTNRLFKQFHCMLAALPMRI